MDSLATKTPRGNDYHFVSRWRVRAAPGEVYRIIEDAEGLPRWWPAAYEEVTLLEKGDSEGVGSEYSLVTMGWLPYKLRWRFRTVEKRFPERIAIEALGDFVGRGVWDFKADGEWTDITFDWRIRAEKPIVRAMSPILKPVFAANHRWAMKRGQDSLRLEVERRRAESSEELARIPTPPGKANPTVPIVAGVVVAAVLVGIFLRRRDSDE